MTAGEFRLTVWGLVVSTGIEICHHLPGMGVISTNKMQIQGFENEVDFLQ